MFLTRNMTPQPLMDCFAAHQSYKDSIKARRALKKRKKGEKNICFSSNFLVCVKLKSTAKQESIQSNFLFPIELHALNLRNTCHFAVEENLVVLCVCVCVYCCTTKGSPEEGRSLSVCHRTQAAKFYEIPNY